MAANNTLLMRKQNQLFLLMAITLLWKMADRIVSQRYSLKNKLGHGMIKHIELSYRKISWFASVSLADHVIIDLLATNKSRDVAHCCLIIVNSFWYESTVVKVDSYEANFTLHEIHNTRAVLQQCLVVSGVLLLLWGD